MPLGDRAVTTTLPETSAASAHEGVHKLKEGKLGRGEAALVDKRTRQVACEERSCVGLRKTGHDFVVATKR